MWLTAVHLFLKLKMYFNLNTYAVPCNNIACFSKFRFFAGFSPSYNSFYNYITV